MFQRVVLNDIMLDRLPVKAGFPQGSLSVSLFFLIYISNIIDLVSIVKLLADDTTLSPIIHDAKTTAYELDSGNYWDISWKFHFNPYLNKQA